MISGGRQKEKERGGRLQTRQEQADAQSRWGSIRGLKVLKNASRSEGKSTRGPKESGAARYKRERRERDSAEYQRVSAIGRGG